MARAEVPNAALWIRVSILPACPWSFWVCYLHFTHFLRLLHLLLLPLFAPFHYQALTLRPSSDFNFRKWTAQINPSNSCSSSLAYHSFLLSPGNDTLTVYEFPPFVLILVDFVDVDCCVYRLLDLTRRMLFFQKAVNLCLIAFLIRLALVLTFKHQYFGTVNLFTSLFVQMKYCKIGINNLV